ncbi:MAG: peptidase T [Atopobiaceae bacterium]|nr:peptidase T [Atopobiaceae bacterium]
MEGAMSDVVERFMRYVQVDSQSNPANEAEVPSTSCQHDMARLLGDELRALGCDDVRVDTHAYVTASVPASPGAEHQPALGLCAHLDTSPDVPGASVKPHVVHYEGGDLVSGVVNGVPIATTVEQVPDLKKFVGQDIICSDGSTLLSADDKAGVAEICALVARLQAHPELPHPTLKIAFVPDEEIGHGAGLLDLEQFGAKWCYTVDGAALGEFNYECFSACQVDVTIHGVAVHPGSAKNVMINAITLAGEFGALVPAAERPEHTEGREGFYHPIAASGTARKMKLSYLIRDFDADGFEARQQTLCDIAAYMNQRYGERTVEVQIRQQYRNMAEQFKGIEFLIDYALEANREVGIVPTTIPVRGGTDGAQLTFRGLPCPNIATGGYNYHSVREFVPVKSLEVTVDLLERLVAKFALRSAS